MAVDDYRVPGASENPLDITKVPKEPVEVTFPVRTHSIAQERRHVTDTVLCMFFAAFWSVLAIDTLFPWSKGFSWELCWTMMLLFVAFTFVRSVNAPRMERWSGLYSVLAVVVLSGMYPWLSVGGSSLWLLAALLFFTYSFNDGLSFQRRSTWADSMFRWLVPVGVTVVVVIGGMQVLKLTGFMPWVCGVLLFAQGVAFREHTIERAVVGMLDEKTAKRFRLWKTLPKGLKPEPRLDGLLAAIRCYLSYNLKQVSPPGTFQTPTGPPALRIGLSVSLVCTLSVCFYVIGVPKVANLSEQFAKEPMPGFSATAMMLLCPLAAMTAWMLTLFLFTARFIGAALALKKKQVSPSHWRRMLDRMDESENQHERDGLWIGWCNYDNSPIIYPTSRLFQHAWISGGSGSGKTAWTMGLIDQLIYRTDVQVVVVDCKANNCEILPMMKRAAEARHRKRNEQASVKHFTLKEGHSTYLLDVFSQSWWKTLPTPQRTGTILSALSLNYATVYGASYYRDAAYEFLSYVLSRHPDVRSWVELIKRMQDALASAKPWELSKGAKEDGEHVVWIVKRLASLSALNNDGSLPRSVQNNAIDFSDGHYYFALNPRENGLITGEVGRLIVACVLAAAYANRNKRTILVCDEWQLIVTRELEELLTQSRDLNVGCVLANQNAAQLKTKDCDLIPIVEGNASLNAWMKVSDYVGMEQVQRLGGKQLDWLTGTSQRSGQDPSWSMSETVRERVTANLIAEVSSEPSQFLLRLCGNSGYACYRDLMFTAKTMFHQTKKAYEHDVAQPWPAQSAETLINQNTLTRYNPSQNTAQSVSPGRKRRSANRLG